MKPLKTKISITLDNEIVDKLKELSEQDDRSLSQYINLILKEYLKKKQTKTLDIY
ncbi:MAG: ribbon-helix-helix protein, CopG family [Ruminococcaceae bacterium]|nr:ribbon-helix-helix protein, CopG family [Oscillospiraceae bacterium]